MPMGLASRHYPEGRLAQETSVNEKAAGRIDINRTAPSDSAVNVGQPGKVKNLQPGQQYNSNTMCVIQIP